MSKKISNNAKEFLLTFFTSEEIYQEKEVNGFWLVKCWDGNVNKWHVLIYTNESYRNYRSFSEQQEKLDFIKGL